MALKSSLAQHTQSFWIVSREYNGSGEGKLTVEASMKRLNKILESCPHQKLRLKVDSLLDGIVYNGKAPTTRGKKRVGGRQNQVVRQLREYIEK